MRHMSTPRANGRIIRLVVALVIGVAATSISAYWPLYMVDRGGGAGQVETVPETPVRVVAQEQTVPGP